VKLKICLIGEEAVGKTSLVRRFVESQFDEEYKRTIGTTVSKRILEVEDEGSLTRFDLIIYDIIGDQRFIRLFREAYFKHARGVLAVFDLTRPETLKALSGWISELQKVGGPTPVVILGNKADLTDQIKTTDEDILTVAKAFDAPYMRTSAKTGDNVEEAFSQLVRMATEETAETPKVTP
jgi:small GTP-binding protein